MTRPQTTPIGLQLAKTARTVSQAFERRMAEAGGSAAAWQVLLLVRSGQWDTQSGLAKAMGVTGATMTHHLNALESQGLVRRWRDQSNRRVQQVELPDAGIELFDRGRGARRGLRRGSRPARGSPAHRPRRSGCNRRRAADRPREPRDDRRAAPPAAQGCAYARAGTARALRPDRRRRPPGP